MKQNKEKSENKVNKALYGQLRKLLEIEELLVTNFKENGENNVEQTTLDLIARINAATNSIAARIQALIDAAAASGSVTTAEVNTALNPVVASLEAMGKDPENPV